jgi:fermentation-respiration switch protein FrsA (DUF1100 family)
MTKQTLLLILLGFFLIFAYIKYIERKGIYYPTKKIDLTPASLGLKYENVFFKTTDGLKLNGWFIPAEASRGTLLFCHGNAGNIGHRLDKIILFHNLHLNTFIIDYRGYGRSEGGPSENGIYLDAEAAYNYLVNKRNIKPEQIILYGESLGCGVIIDLAARKRVGALIAEGAFSRGKDMAKRIYPFLPSFLFSNSFDCLTKIKKIAAPKLFMHSRDDEVVPYSLARRLYNAADEPKYFAELRGDHNNAFLDSQEIYISSISSFIERLRSISVSE